MHDSTVPTPSDVFKPAAGDRLAGNILDQLDDLQQNRLGVDKTIEPFWAWTLPMECVSVTRENTQAVAEWCGGKVFETEDKNVPGSTVSYVQVPVRDSARIAQAFPGSVVARKTTVGRFNKKRVVWAVFNRGYFNANVFVDPNAAIEAQTAE